MSDERDGTGAAGDGSTTEDGDTATTERGSTAVATRPTRPTGKRSRQAAAAGDGEPVDGDATLDDGAQTDGAVTKNGSGKKPKTARKQSGPGRNPIRYVITYLQQVYAELRKVIWPNRKQMVSYTTVVLIFLAFMVALISGVDLGLNRVIGLVFGA